MGSRGREEAGAAALPAELPAAASHVAVLLAASAEKRRPARRAVPLGAGLPPAGLVVWLHWGPRWCYARRRGSVSPGRYGGGQSGRIQQPDLAPSTPKARSW